MLIVSCECLFCLWQAAHIYTQNAVLCAEYLCVCGIKREAEQKTRCVCHKLCSFTLRMLNGDWMRCTGCVCVSAQVCGEILNDKANVCQTLKYVDVKSVFNFYMPRFFLAKVAVDWGIQIIIIKSILFSLFEVGELPFLLPPLSNPLKPINSAAHTHCTHPHTHKPSRV